MKKETLCLLISALIPLGANSSEKAFCKVTPHSPSEKISLPEDKNMTSIFVEQNGKASQLFTYTREDGTHHDADSLELLFDFQRDETDGIHRVNCRRLKIKEGALDKVYAWFQALIERKDELYRAFEHEGIYLESVFLERGEDGDYLIYYSRHDHLDRAHTMVCLPIRLFHFECQQKCTERGKELKILFDHRVK